MSNIVLIGPMGSGKSTVGAALARRLGRPHVDSDHFFVARYGPIPDYFTTHGEKDFREREHRVVAELLDSPRPSVISLGGGAVMDERTRALLKDQTVVMLDITPDQAALRIGDGTSRPVLGDEPMEAWTRIYAEREAIYRACADMVLSADDESIETRADTIVARLNPTPSGDDTTP